MKRVKHKYDEWIGICGTLGIRVYRWKDVTCKRCLKKKAQGGESCEKENQ